ncbi:hypothetical protein EMCRGX_G015993 [Ephydatia muelleri]
MAVQLADALDVVKDVDDWLNLGRCLGVEDHVLKMIQSGHEEGTDRKRETLAHWLVNDSAASWEKLTAALERAGYGELVSRLRSSERHSTKDAWTSPVTPDPIPYNAESVFFKVSSEPQLLATSVPASAATQNSPVTLDGSAVPRIEVKSVSDKGKTLDSGHTHQPQATTNGPHIPPSKDGSGSCIHTLSITSRKAAPVGMWKGTSTSNGHLCYFSTRWSEDVHVYDSSTDSWSTMTKYPYKNFTLVMVNGLLTGWVEHFPRMTTCRLEPAAACGCGILVVVGGWSGAYLTTVEVMDTTTLHWTTVAPLPQPIMTPSATVCKDTLFVDGVENAIFACSLPDLRRNIATWVGVAPFPTKWTSSGCLSGELVAVGGRDSHSTPIPTIYRYSMTKKHWGVIGTLTTPRSSSLLVEVPGGGWWWWEGWTPNIVASIPMRSFAQVWKP